MPSDAQILPLPFMPLSSICLGAPVEQKREAFGASTTGMAIRDIGPRWNVEAVSMRCSRWTKASLASSARAWQAGDAMLAAVVDDGGKDRGQAESGESDERA